MIALLTLALACTPAGGDSGVAADSGGAPYDSPTPWTYDGEGGGELPSVDAATAAAVLQEALDAALSYESAPVFAAYQSAASTRDAQCVTYEENINDAGTVTAHRWIGFSFCGVDESSAFMGQCFGYVAQDARLADYDQWSSALAEGLNMEDYGDVVVTGHMVLGQGYIDTPDGDQYQGAGSFSATRGVDDARGTNFWISYVSGTFRWTGDEGAGTWLDRAPSVDWLARVDYPQDDPDAVTITLVGSLAAQPLTGGTINTESLVIGADLGCPDEPVGEFKVRDDAGRWAVGAFDADTGGACDGCGALVSGVDAGSAVCVDVGPLLGAARGRTW